MRALYLASVSMHVLAAILCGVDTIIEIECPDCFTVQEVELPFDRGFFLPGRDRTARRKARSSSSPE